MELPSNSSIDDRTRYVPTIATTIFSKAIESSSNVEDAQTGTTDHPNDLRDYGPIPIQVKAIPLVREPSVKLDHRSAEDRQTSTTTAHTSASLPRTAAAADTERVENEGKSGP